jgi:hypothetical protein
VVFHDKDGHRRDKMRIKWYRSPENETFQTFALPSNKCYPDLPLPQNVLAQIRPYPANDNPVFVGNYWLQAEHPEILANNVACLDYSVAKGGFLCGYRWNGEPQLSNDQFVVER